MAHVVSGLIRKEVFTKDNCGADGQSKMYAVDLSEMTKDYRSGEKSYANYRAVFFAKTDAARSYYDQALAEGSFVVVSCEKLKVEQREHNGSVYITLNMDNARLEDAHFDGQQQGGQSQQAPRQQRGQQQQQSGAQAMMPSCQQQQRGQQQQQSGAQAMMPSYQQQQQQATQRQAQQQQNYSQGLDDWSDDVPF